MKDIKQMSKRYETARKKEHLKQGDEQNKFIHYIAVWGITLLFLGHTNELRNYSLVTHTQ